MEAAGSTRVTRQFQVTIPKKAREALKIGKRRCFVRLCRC
jgi:bifunctional DNA-binding transcriptional regulator/antitoxin component of YhaV-PrlF toxin-antitoxin module